MAKSLIPFTKPLQVNPLRLTQPMGAALAFLGVDQCMPLMHGALGCTSFTKVFFTRHFCEPIAIQTTAVNDIMAVLDGGDYSIGEAVRAIVAKVPAQLIGLHSTGLTETKGDDLRRIAQQIETPLVYVHSPDYEGGIESGWALATKAMIEQLVAPTTQIRPNKLLLLPNVNMQPIEVEKVMQFVGSFGFDVVALPDLSTSLDGYLGEKQGALSGGGIDMATLRGVADAGWVMSVGCSMQNCARALQKKNPAIGHLHFNHLQGLAATDELVRRLLEISPQSDVPPMVVRWRQRLQDALIDSHFSLGQTRVLIALEPDQAVGVAAALREAGATIGALISSVDAAHLEMVEAHHLQVGDMEDVEALHSEADMIISNFHAERICHRHHKAHMVRGFPNWEQVGNPLKNDLLYEGSCYFLFEAANLAAEHRR